MKNIVIFASGSGSNALNMINFFADKPDFNISEIITNNKDAGVINHAVNHHIPYQIISKTSMADDSFLDHLKEIDTNIIILAGFLLKIPASLVEAFPNAIVNIHPALLPKFGGKGMYGQHVHKAVVEQKETESGITIHYVNEKYDDGATIFQAKCTVLPTDTANEVDKKVRALEQLHFPEVIYNTFK